MKLFGWKSAGRASARPAQLLAALSRAPFGAGGDWPLNYEAQLREGYLKNPVAQRAVRILAEGAASCPVKGNDPAAVSLVRTTTHGQSLIETLCGQLLLHGNAYVQIAQAPDGRPCELYALRPERMSVEGDARGWPVAFRYKVGQTIMRMNLSEIIHIRTHHPLDDHYGLGCLGAASGPIAIHNASSKWNKALLDNAARPSGALLSEGVEALKPEQFERLKGELELAFQGAANAGRPLLLEGGLKWQPLSMSPADMDFAGLKAAAAREIALAFGVPPVLLGLPGDATYSNYREANRALWRQSIMPLAQKIASAITQGLTPWFPGLEMGLDVDAIPALAEEREALWAQLEAASFLTVDEKRAAAGFPALPRGTPAEPDYKNKTRSLELKYNPWHDTENGQFTRVGHGQRFGFGGIAARPQKAVRPPKPKTDDFKPGGGSFGGGGGQSNESWDVPEPKSIPRPKIVPKPDEIPKLPKLRIEPAQTDGPEIVVRAKKERKKISANGYDFELDGLKRTVRASGQLRIDTSGKRSKTNQRAAGGADRLPRDDGGHYIAHRFGGPNDGFNHFAQDANFNRSSYKKLENRLNKLLLEKKSIFVNVVPTYIGNSERPVRIDVNYIYDGKSNRETFPNTSKGK